MPKNKTVSKRKKGKEEKAEEEKLEEVIKKEKIEEQPPEIESFEFEEFLQEPEFQTGSPSLKKINASQREIISLEKDLIDSPRFGKKEAEDDSFKYTTGANPEEPKYHNYGGEIVSD